MTRNPDGARFASGVEIRKGDLTVPESLDSCLDGIEKVFLVWIAPRRAIAPALERITRRARHIVFLSAPLKTPHPLFQQPNAARVVAEEIEQRIGQSGVEWTFLRPGMLAVNALSWWAPQIREGDVVRWPCLSTPTAPVHERDIAAVAVRVLCDKGHAGSEYVLTGPESLTQAEQIARIGKVIGRRLQAHEISRAEAEVELLRVIAVPPVVKMLLDAWEAAEGQPAYVTDTVERLTGKPARTFHDWAVDHAAAFVA